MGSGGGSVRDEIWLMSRPIGSVAGLSGLHYILDVFSMHAESKNAAFALQTPDHVWMQFPPMRAKMTYAIFSRNATTMPADTKCQSIFLQIKTVPISLSFCPNHPSSC